MKRIYVLGPLVGLLVFGVFHWQHAKAHAARQVEIARQTEDARKAKEAEHAAARAQATEQARLAVLRRNQERAEEEKTEEARRQLKAELEQRRDTAIERAHRLRPQLDRLRSEIETVTAALARNEDRRRELEQEQAFLAGFVRQAETNREEFYRVLAQLEAAERAPAAPPSGQPRPRPPSVDVRG